MTLWAAIALLATVAFIMAFQVQDHVRAVVCVGILLWSFGRIWVAE